MERAADSEYQKRYFDLEPHQYPRAAILEPPLHTALEIRSLLDRLADLPPGAPIIDFGSGTGRLSIPLAQAGYSVLAVDVSGRSLQVLCAIARDLGLANLTTATALPEGGGFSAVVGADVLHHVDMDEYLPEIRARLPVGGKVVFSEPGGLNPAWYVYLPVCHELRVERRIVTCNVRTLRRTFERCKFSDVRITGLGLLPRPLFSWARTACRLHDAVGNWPVLRWFAYRYIVEGTS